MHIAPANAGKPAPRQRLRPGEKPPEPQMPRSEVTFCPQSRTGKTGEGKSNSIKNVG